MIRQIGNKHFMTSKDLGILLQVSTPTAAKLRKDFEVLKIHKTEFICVESVLEKLDFLTFDQIVQKLNEGK